MAAVCALVALPAFMFLLARLGQAPMIYRYSVACVAGLSCALGWAFAKRPRFAVIVLAAIMVQAVMDFRQFRWSSSIEEPSSSTPIPTISPAYAEDFEWMRSSPHRNVPIVLLDWLEFSPMFHYAPKDLLPRLVFLTASDKYTSQNYLYIQSCCQAPGRVTSLDTLLSTTPSFLVYGPPRFDWLLDQFVQKGAKVSVEKTSPSHGLFFVDYGAGGAAPAK